MNLDRNVLQIVHRYIHESLTRKLIAEYHLRVKYNYFTYITFNNLAYNYRYLDNLDNTLEIYDLNGNEIIYNHNTLLLPRNY
jgi:hypothetical protein